MIKKKGILRDSPSEFMRRYDDGGEEKKGAWMEATDLSVGQIGQVGIVVRDLQAAMDGFSRTLGIGTWRIFTNSAPPLKCVYRQKAVNYKVRVALANSGPVTIELIQYLEGDTIHRDFLDTGREGVEHLGIYVPDLDKALAYFKKQGIGELQSADGLGVKGDGRYVYLDTEATLGTILELIQVPSERVPPDQVYSPMADSAAAKIDISSSDGGGHGNQR